MKVTDCKLLRKEPLKLLEYCVLEVTARSATDVLDIQADSAALFYRKLRKVIVAVVYTDGYRSYNALDISDCYHERINHGQLFGNGTNHINGIANFGAQAKRALRKYNGIPKESFPLFLKECEFRFNYGSPKQQLALLKKRAGL